MVRTKASATGVRVSAAKAPRKFSTPAVSNHTASSPSTGAKKASLTRNAACPQPVPDWQKPISSFFNSVPKKEADEPTRDEQAEKVHEEDPMECSDDDKENQNPEEANHGDEAQESSSKDQSSPGKEPGPSSSPTAGKPSPINDDEPGPSNRHPHKSKRRRVLMIESDSEEEDEEGSKLGCIADVADEITAS